MTRSRSTLAALGLALVAGSAAAPAFAQDYRPQDDRRPIDRPQYDRDGPRPDRDDVRGDRRDGGLVGRGVGLLLPELRDTPRGRAFVMERFDFNHDGYVSPEEANAANRAFEDRGRGDRRDRDHRFDDGRRFDHDRRDDRPDFREAPVPPAPPPPPVIEQRGWDRQGMRDYHFRQGRYGAVFNIDDVLFETGSARLRPGFEAKLRPLIGYLRNAPNVKVRIDGYTDSVGSDASNLQLSKDRARSVADAITASGVDGRRLQLSGHGETSPIATNATDAGRRLNRRVEVTLVGQQASSFR